MEWLWIALIVLLLFGADKLPKLARGLGKSLGEFRKAKEEFEKEIHAATNTDETKALAEKNNPTVTPASAVPVEDELTKKS